MSKQHPAAVPANPRENTMNTNQETTTVRHATAWSLGRRANDRLFHKRILPGRYLDWDAWETMTRAALVVAA
jgi:hypothetical protein